MEIFYTILYALFIGFYDVFKKLSLKKSNMYVVLVLFTTTAFLCSLIWVPFGIAISFNFILLFALKGFLLALSWAIILSILKNADISLVTITKLFSSVLTFILGITIFHEKASALQIIGSIIIVLAIAAFNLLDKQDKRKTTISQLALLLLSALITSMSNVIDKYTTQHLSAFQVQFWFLLFVCLFSWVIFAFLCIKNRECRIKKLDLKNYWIYLIGLFLFIGDFFLFQAYKIPNSQMITIAILSKLKIIITVFAGIIIFKEKNILKKLILTFIIILGVILISI